jgi:hypothetical protein
MHISGLTTRFLVEVKVSAGVEASTKHRREEANRKLAVAASEDTQADQLTETRTEIIQKAETCNRGVRLQHFSSTVTGCLATAQS